MEGTWSLVRREQCLKEGTWPLVKGIWYIVRR